MEPGAGAVPRSGVHPKKFWGGCKKNDPHVYIYQIIPHNHTMIPIIPSNIIQHVVVFELGGPFLFFFGGTCSEHSPLVVRRREQGEGSRTNPLLQVGTCTVVAVVAFSTRG